MGRAHVLGSGELSGFRSFVESVILVVEYPGELKVNLWEFFEILVPPNRLQVTYSISRYLRL